MKCLKCEAKIILDLVGILERKNVNIPVTKLEAMCSNNVFGNKSCEKLYWYYIKSGKITERKEY